MAKAKAEKNLQEVNPEVNEQNVVETESVENPKKVETRADRIAREKARCEELVTIRFNKTGDKNRDSLFVAVGGKNILIKAGVPVRVPRKFALVIEEKLRQEQLLSERIELLTSINHGEF